jgi:hypothetical protein
VTKTITTLIVANRLICKLAMMQMVSNLLPNIVDFTCPDSMSLAEYKCMVEAWPGLTRLTTGSGLCNQGLLLIAQKCRHLEIVHISGADGVTEEGKKQFIQNVTATLQNLTIWSHWAAPRRTTGLYETVAEAHLLRLRLVDIKRCTTTEETLLRIAQRCPLDTFDTSCLATTGDTLRELSRYCKLQTLSILGRDRLTDWVLSNGAGLQSLTCSGLASAIGLLPKVLGLSSPLLRYLELRVSGQEMELYGWDTLAAGCPQLTVLHMMSYGMEDRDVCAIAQGCSRLQELTLTDSLPHRLSDLALQAVAAHCSDLRELGLERCEGMTDAGLWAVAVGCTRLTSLVTRKVPCSATALLALSQYSSRLKTLRMDALTGANDDSLTALAQGCTRLRHISFSRVQDITVVGIAALAQHSAFLRTGHLRLLKPQPQEELASLIKLFRSDVDVKIW